MPLCIVQGSYDGNQDTETVVTQWLAKVVHARYVRIIPTKWEKSCCLRLEVLGCDGGKEYLSQFFFLNPLSPSAK